MDVRHYVIGVDGSLKGDESTLAQSKWLIMIEQQVQEGLLCSEGFPEAS